MKNYHTPPNTAFVSIHDRAWALVAEAEDAGIVLEIKNVSCHPLAMGNTMMMVYLRPARIRERPIQRLDIQAMAAEALERVNRRIAEQCEFEKNEVRNAFAYTNLQCDERTWNSCVDLMQITGLYWRIKPFAVGSK